MPRRRWCRCSRRGQGGSRFRQAQKGVGGKQPRRVIHLRPALLLPHLHLKAVTRQISRVASHMEQQRQRKRGQQCADASRRLQQLIVLLQQSARGAQSLILEPQCELVRCDLRTSTDTPKLKPAARQAQRVQIWFETPSPSRGLGVVRDPQREQGAVAAEFKPCILWRDRAMTSGLDEIDTFRRSLQ